jgi:hypothetical protein
MSVEGRSLPSGNHCSITASASASNFAGTLTPRILAVLGFMRSRRLQYRKIGRLGALEDAAGVNTCLAMLVREICSASHQATRHREAAK